MQPAAPDKTPDPDRGESPADTAHHIGDQVTELFSYLGQYVAAKLDLLRLSLRNAILYAAFGIVAIIGAAAALVTAVVLLILGIAQGIAELCGHRPWAGNLIVGILLVGGVLGILILVINKIFNVSRAKTVQRYEQRHQQQRSRTGHDAKQRSAQKFHPARS